MFAALLSLCLLAAGVSPGPEFFAAHRQKLVEKLPADTVAVFRTAPETSVETSPDPYRQDSSFWYLTGFAEPDAVAVLRPAAGAGRRYVLFVAERDFPAEQWTGWRAGSEGAKRDFGADEAYPIGELATRLPELLAGARSLYYGDGGDARFKDQLVAVWNPGDANAREVRPIVDAAPVLNQLRLVKDETEIALLRRAAQLSAEAHVAALRALKPGAYEYALKAEMLRSCLAGGATRMAYPPIVGSGRNSVILHYERDDARMAAGEMVVNDSACEYAMYAADVTRSYPVSGRFTPEQKIVYDIVLRAQKVAMAKVRPGTALRDVHQASVEVIVDGLLRLGILTGDREQVLKDRTYQRFYPHGCSHWLGLNVHDVGSYGYPEGVERKARYGLAMTPLQPGMLLTVEPGIYIPEGATSDKRFWNIGVRLEDDVLVTKEGMECLSCAAPREPADVEKAISGR
jgi:Xaa-Pro aminopeptidase